jgi:hypothetical protein
VFAAIAEAYAAGEVADSFAASARHILNDFTDAALMRDRERLDRMANSVRADMKAHYYFVRALAAARDGDVQPRPDPALWRGTDAEAQPPAEQR